MVLFADMEPDVMNQPSPRPSSSAIVPGLPDCFLLGEVKSTPEAGTQNPPPHPKVDDFDISVQNLPEKLGFSPEFQEELVSIGGNVHSLAEKLLNSLPLDDSGHLRAGQLCSNPEQLEFYSKTLDTGPIVIR